MPIVISTQVNVDPMARRSRGPFFFAIDPEEVADDQGPSGRHMIRFTWTIQCRAHPPREDAQPDVFAYIELFYNPMRKHTNNGMPSSVAFEEIQQKLNQVGVQETRGTSDRRCLWMPRQIGA